MYNTGLNGIYNPQISIDRINNQIAELEKMKSQIPPSPVPPTNLTQNFQLAPNNTSIRYAESIDEVQKDIIIGDTPFFSRDLSILWIKNTKGEIKTYELVEIIKKDEKDIQIEILQAQIEELKKGIAKDEPSNEIDDEPIEIKKSANVSKSRKIKK